MATRLLFLAFACVSLCRAGAVGKDRRIGVTSGDDDENIQFGDALLNANSASVQDDEKAELLARLMKKLGIGAQNTEERETDDHVRQEIGVQGTIEREVGAAVRKVNEHEVETVAQLQMLGAQVQNVVNTVKKELYIDFVLIGAVLALTATVIFALYGFRATGKRRFETEDHESFLGRPSRQFSDEKPQSDSSVVSNSSPFSSLR